MLNATELRLRMHDLVCMSGCGRVPDEWPNDITEDFRQDYIANTVRRRIEHARTMTGPAKAFRAPGANRLQVIHDTVCANGATCPKGVAHLPARVRDLAAEWETA